MSAVISRLLLSGRIEPCVIPAGPLYWAVALRLPLSASSVLCSSVHSEIGDELTGSGSMDRIQGGSNDCIEMAKQLMKGFQEEASG